MSGYVARAKRNTLGPVAAAGALVGSGALVAAGAAVATGAVVATGFGASVVGVAHAESKNIAASDTKTIFRTVLSISAPPYKVQNLGFLNDRLEIETQ